MSGAKKILVAICFSDYCTDTFAFAAGLARDLDAELVAANVINERDVEAVGRIETMGYDLHPGEYVEQMKRERLQLLRQMIEANSLGDRCRPRVEVGHPVEWLLQMVDELDIDLVVMGAKGRTNLPHLLVGSVAEKMFRHCPVTVVSYRRRQHQRRPT